MRKLLFSYLRPQHYFSRVLSLYMFLAFTFTISLMNFHIGSFDVFLLKFVVIFFELISIAVIVEFFRRGEYMSPLEYYDAQNFFNGFIGAVKGNFEEGKKFFSKYNSEVVKSYVKIFSKPNLKYFYLSSVHKVDNNYELVFFDDRKLFYFYFFKFLVRNPLHRMVLHKVDGEFRIISLK